MLADQGQLLLLLGQLAQDVLDEVVRGDGSQVPLQLAQHYQLPLLQRVGGKALKIRRGLGSRPALMILIKAQLSDQDHGGGEGSSFVALPLTL